MTSSMALTLFYAIKQKSTFIESVCARHSQSDENKRQMFFFSATLAKEQTYQISDYFPNR